MAESQHILLSREMAALVGQLGPQVATLEVLMETYKRDNFAATSMMPGMMAQRSQTCIAILGTLFQRAGAIHAEQMRLLMPAEAPKPPAAKKQRAPKPVEAEPIVETADEIASATSAAAPPSPLLGGTSGPASAPQSATAQPTPIARPKSGWDSSAIISAAAPTAAAATEQFQHNPKVVEAPVEGAPIDIGNKIMLKVPRASAPTPGSIVQLGPHHFVVPVAGFGRTHFIHTTGMGRSHLSLSQYTQVFNRSLGRTQNGFFVNPFGPHGDGVGTNIVRNMPAMIFLGAPDKSTQEMLIHQKVSYTALPVDLRNADTFRASVAKLDEHNLENLHEVMAFVALLYAAIQASLPHAQ